MKLITTVRGGHVHPYSREIIAKTLKGFEGKNVEIEIKEKKQTRSLPQNKYWFKMIEDHLTPVFREEGSNWSSWDIHQYIMHELGYEEVIFSPSGKPFPKRKHSSDMTTLEFEEFAERARAYVMQEFNVAIPFPNEKREPYNN